MQPSSPNDLRIEPSATGVSIWSRELFGQEVGPLREVITRAFSLSEVQGVELRRAHAFGRIRHGATRNPAELLRKLGRALRGEKTNGSRARAPAPPLDASALFLDVPRTAAVRVSRVGDTLTTWRVRGQTEHSVQLWHPALRGHRELVFRLEEELAALHGVEGFRTSVWSGALSVRLDAERLGPARLVHALERAWPRLLEGVQPPPSRTRFFVATGLLGLGVTGQFVVPAVRPVAVLGAALYSSPNALAAARDLARGQVGLPALYTTGLAFMLASGMPFASTLFATLGQVWPNLGHSRLVRSQRRLFAAHRRRPGWARLAQANGSELEIAVEGLRGGELIAVRRGEVVPVDGVVVSGLAAVVTPAALGARIEDLGPGDAVAAGSSLRDGQLSVRVERAAGASAASVIDTLLPHARLPETPAAQEVERIANRNARPALALALASLAVTRTLRLSQAVIRPDYATAPRLGAQLSALQGLAEALSRGVVLRSPAALDHLASVEVFVIDESAGVERRQVEVATVEATGGSTQHAILQYALTAQRHGRSERHRALAAAAHASGVTPLAGLVSRHAGFSRFHAEDGSRIEVAAGPYLQLAGIPVPQPFQARLHASSDRDARPLWVLRNGQLVGVVSFAQRGEPAGRQLVAALRAHDRSARIVYVSHGPDADVQALGARLGVDLAYGGLSHASKTQLLESSPRRSLWLGDGSRADVREALAASTVSASVAPASSLHADRADVLLLDDGLAQLPTALALGRAHRGRLSSDYRRLYAVNLLSVLGAFGARLTGLQAGLLSNAATFWIYARHAGALDRLAAESEATRSRLLRALHP